MKTILDNITIDEDNVYFVPFEQSKYPEYNIGAIIKYCEENGIKPPDLSDTELERFVVPAKSARLVSKVEPLESTPKKRAFA